MILEKFVSTISVNLDRAAQVIVYLKLPGLETPE